VIFTAQSSQASSRSIVNWRPMTQTAGWKNSSD
jgi:hypothetical protein